MGKMWQCRHSGRHDMDSTQRVEGRPSMNMAGICCREEINVPVSLELSTVGKFTFSNESSFL